MLKYAGSGVWNGVPSNMPNAPLVEAFKYAYKKLNFKVYDPFVLHFNFVRLIVL